MVIETSKIEVFLSLPSWLSQFSWDSQPGRDRKTSILVLAFWNFKPRSTNTLQTVDVTTPWSYKSKKNPESAKVHIYFISDAYDDKDDSNDSQGRRSKGADDCPPPHPESKKIILVGIGSKHFNQMILQYCFLHQVFKPSAVSDSLSRILWINQHSWWAWHG